MKSRKYKFSINAIVNSLSMLDLHCAWMGHIRQKYKKRIGLDGDKTGNGNGPYMELVCLPCYIKVAYGDQVTKQEKKLRFLYEDYDEVDDYCDNLAKFIIKYFDSFKLVRKL